MRRFGSSAQQVYSCCAVSWTSQAASAASVLSAQGAAVIEGGNISLAEKIAIQDAYAKAVTMEALKSVAPSSTYAVTKKFLFLASRGTQDITQYKITARSQQAAYLYLTVEFHINDAFLRDWITQNKYHVPASLRPRILIAVSSNAPGEGLHEWWYMKGRKGYSLFESQLAAELAQWGENVFSQAPDLGMLASRAPIHSFLPRGSVQYCLSRAASGLPPGGRFESMPLEPEPDRCRHQGILRALDTLTRRSDLPVADMQAS